MAAAAAADRWRGRHLSVWLRTFSIEFASVDDLVLSVGVFPRLSLSASSFYRSIGRCRDFFVYQLLSFCVPRSHVLPVALLSRRVRDLLRPRLVLAPMLPSRLLLYQHAFRPFRRPAPFPSFSPVCSPFLTIAFHGNFAPSADRRLTVPLTRRRLCRYWIGRRGVSPVRLLVEVRVQIRHIVRLVTRPHSLHRRGGGGIGGWARHNGFRGTCAEAKDVAASGVVAAAAAAAAAAVNAPG